MEKQQADPARLTDSDEGKAIGSAKESSSFPQRVAGGRHDE